MYRTDVPLCALVHTEWTCCRIRLAGGPGFWRDGEGPPAPGDCRRPSLRTYLRNGLSCPDRYLFSRTSSDELPRSNQERTPLADPRRTVAPRVPRDYPAAWTDPDTMARQTRGAWANIHRRPRHIRRRPPQHALEYGTRRPFARREQDDRRSLPHRLHAKRNGTVSCRTISRGRRQHRDRNRHLSA